MYSFLFKKSNIFLYKKYASLSKNRQIFIFRPINVKKWSEHKV